MFCNHALCKAKGERERAAAALFGFWLRDTLQKRNKIKDQRTRAGGDAGEREVLSGGVQIAERMKEGETRFTRGWRGCGKGVREREKE